MIQAEVYFDESESADHNILCVAGYVLETREGKRLSQEWNKVLAHHRLSYFRMSECAHGNGEFAGRSTRERVTVETKMIEIIKARTVLGIATTANSNEYAQLVPRDAWSGTPYSFLCHIALAGVVPWIEQKPQGGVTKVAYFFEAGHANWAESNTVMNDIFANENRRDQYKYGGHGFVPKVGTPAVQAADLLAWQWYTDQRHQAEGRPRRKDCASLLEHWHVALHLDREKILELRDDMILAAEKKRRGEPI